MMPTFRTIRRFSSKVAELSQLAARDYEDILQCAVPAFSGLFQPAVDHDISRLLVRFGVFHGLVKLRMHTTSSIILLWNNTIRLASALRHFRDVICSQFNTVETPSEQQKRRRIAAAQPADTIRATETSSGPRNVKFNLNTPKFHSFGDYAAYVEMGVTLDSVTTGYVSRHLAASAGGKLTS